MVLQLLGGMIRFVGFDSVCSLEASRFGLRFSIFWKNPSQ